MCRNLALLTAVAATLVGGCMQRAVNIPRAELANIPQDGEVVVIDQAGGHHEIQARRVTVLGKGDLLDDMVRDGILFTPKDTLRLPASPDDLAAFTGPWLADPTWTEAEVVFEIVEPEVIPWAAGGAAIGALTTGAVTYAVMTCHMSAGTSCEDFQVVRVLVTGLVGTLGAALGGGAGVLGYLYVSSPGYAVAW